MAADRSPIAYVIAGPNGAGKTTFATDFLSEFVQCREFVNADLIAAGLSPFAPETQAMRAGRLRSLSESKNSPKAATRLCIRNDPGGPKLCEADLRIEAVRLQRRPVLSVAPERR